jgi:hypothetical protein
MNVGSAFSLPAQFLSFAAYTLVWETGHLKEPVLPIVTIFAPIA